MTLAFHLIQVIVLPLVGLVLGILARRSLGPAPRRADVVWCLSLVCAWIGLTCLPNSLAVVIDGATRSRGLAHLVDDVLITGAFVLQFVFTCTVAGLWTWRRGGVVALYVVLVGSYMAQWAAHHARYDFYDGYYGHPVPLLIFNLTLVALIITAATLAIWGYARYLQRGAHSSERVVAVSVTIVAGLASSYAVLVFGQIIASALGFGSTQILGFTGPIMGLASSIAAAVIWLLTGKRSRRFRQYIQAIFALRQREIEVDERERQVAVREARSDEREGYIVDLAVWLQDQLTQVHVEIDTRPIAHMATWCSAAGFSRHKTRVTLTATRLTLLTEARVLRLPRYDLSLLPDEDDDPDSARDDLTQEAEVELDFLTDLLRVQQLVDPQTLPAGIEARIEPPGWRREAADAICTALRRPRRRQRFA